MDKQSETPIYDKPSKTQKKQEALSAQELGEKLVKLGPEQLKQIPLPEEVRKAVILARTITKHGGKKRQKQYVGVLMRKIDTAPIREAVLRIEQGDRAHVELHKLAEKWRDELLGGSDVLLAELQGKLPEEEREKLAELVTSARSEAVKMNASPAPSRSLFRFMYQRAAALKK